MRVAYAVMPTDIRHRNPDWDEDELVLALDVYLSAKPADLQKNSPEVADLSAILRRRLSTLGVVGEPTLRNVAGALLESRSKHFRSARQRTVCEPLPVPSGG